MNRRQKIVQQQFLNNEEAVIKRLKQVYGQSLKDIEKKAQALQDDINRLGTLANLAVDDEEKAQFLSMQQSKIYQKQYQDALKKQISSILDNMQVEEFKTVSEYLTKCYEDGFIGTMFDLQGQGIPLCFPLDQEAMVRAVQLDSQISQGLYSRLGEDVSLLKKKITAQVSRGISTGMSFQQVAQQLSAYTNIGYNNAVRITRTEGHRIQVQSAMDACHKAKDKGADVVKQWDAALDARTRESHVAVDGEIRELDKPFSNGLMFPGDPSGGAAEVVNCRCALLQRARWALDEDELKTLQKRAEYFGLDKADTFDDYKSKYLKAVEELEQQVKPKTVKLNLEMTADEVDKIGRHNLYGHWEEYRRKFLGRASTVDFDSLDSSFMYDTVKLGRYKDKEVVERIFTQVDDLSSKFYSPLQKMSWMDKMESAFSNAFATSSHGWGYGSAEMRFNPTKLTGDGIERLFELSQKGYSIKYPKGKEVEYLVAHEFGHCILNIGETLPSKAKNFVQCDFSSVKKARKELESIWDSYLSTVKELTEAHKAIADPLNSRMIFEGVLPTDEERKLMNDARKNLESVKISKYSLTNADEFVAEAFADAVIGENPSEYSKQVYDVILKYFGKG